MDAAWHARPRGSATWTHARLRDIDDVYTPHRSYIIYSFIKLMLGVPRV